MRYLTAVLSLVILCGVATRAGAQKKPRAKDAKAQASETIARIAALNSEAITAFEGYGFTKALRKLEQAVQSAEQGGVREAPELARTYLLMGLGYVAGRNDLYRGLHYFVEGLRMDKQARLPRKLLTPQLNLMFKRAKKTVERVKSPPKIAVVTKKKAVDPEAAKARRSGRGLVHSPIDSAKRGYPIPVKATPGLDIQAHRVFLYYRPAGTVKFQRAPMRQSKGIFRASIPAKATQGRYVHYYIEALDQRGRLAGSKGSARSPNVIIIKG